MALKAVLKCFGFRKHRKQTAPGRTPRCRDTDTQFPKANSRSPHKPQLKPYDEVSDAILPANRAALELPRMNSRSPHKPQLQPYDEVSDAVLQANRAAQELPRMNNKSPHKPQLQPYDEVSDAVLQANRAAQELPRMNSRGPQKPQLQPYDEVSDAVLQANRAAQELPRMNSRGPHKPQLQPYDEVSDAVLQANRTALSSSNREGYYVEVDLRSPVVQISPVMKSESAGRGDLHYVEVNFNSRAVDSPVMIISRENSPLYTEVLPSP